MKVSPAALATSDGPLVPATSSPASGQVAHTV